MVDVLYIVDSFIRAAVGAIRTEGGEVVSVAGDGLLAGDCGQAFGHGRRGLGTWTLAVVNGLATGGADGSAMTRALMTLIALQAIVVGVWLVWRGDRIGVLLNGAAVTWAQLGTCILPPYDWLPSGFVGPLPWAIALLASAAGEACRRPRSRAWPTPNGRR